MDIAHLLGKAAENLFKAIANGLIFGTVATVVATYLAMRLGGAGSLRRGLVMGAAAGGFCGLVMLALSLFA
jgi:hypothetical protein